MQIEPTTMRILQDHRHRDLLREAEKRRLLKEAEANRPSLYARILPHMGSILITVGLKLKAQAPSTATVASAVDC
jgi:hypothetical protein